MTWEHWIALLTVVAPLVRSTIELSRVRRDLDRVLAKLDALEDHAAACDERARIGEHMAERLLLLEGALLARGDDAA